MGRGSQDNRKLLLDGGVRLKPANQPETKAVKPEDFLREPFNQELFLNAQMLFGSMRGRQFRTYNDFLDAANAAFKKISLSHNTLARDMLLKDLVYVANSNNWVRRDSNGMLFVDC